MADIPQVPDLAGGKNLNEGHRSDKDTATLPEFLEAVRTNLLDGVGPIEDTIIEIMQATGA